MGQENTQQSSLVSRGRIESGGIGTTEHVCVVFEETSRYRMGCMMPMLLYQRQSRLDGNQPTLQTSYSNNAFAFFISSKNPFLFG